MFRKFTQWFDRPPKDPQHHNHTCHFPDCQEPGTYRAPKSRYNLDHGVDDWNWFCLQHVRDYNARWNYNAGMNEDQINQDRDEAVTWDRPSWPFGGTKPHFTATFHDPFDLFPGSDQKPPRPQTTAPEAKAMAVLELSAPFTTEDLRTNYRRLAKTYHPDRNGNTPEAEKKIRDINEAYALLKKQ
jgi:hypothetical protein